MFEKIHKASRKPIQDHVNRKCYETNRMKIRALMNKTEQDVGSSMRTSNSRLVPPDIDVFLRGF